MYGLIWKRWLSPTQRLSDPEKHWPSRLAVGVCRWVKGGMKTRSHLAITALFLISISASISTGQTSTIDVPAHTTTWYQHHILAIDEDGNALTPNIVVSGPDKSRHYKGSFTKMEGEDTRNARVNSLALERAVNTGVHTDPPPFSPSMALALKGRERLSNYLTAMFRDVAQTHPDEVIVYIHGGLNNINGAIAKAAMLSDVLATQRKYFIGICWNSNLMPTYDQHLFVVREGLHQKGKAIITSPVMLLADVGGAAVRLPLNLVNFLYQDAYTTRPDATTRTKLANARFTQIFYAPETDTKTPLNRIKISYGADERSPLEMWSEFGRWLVTTPAKASSTVFLDTLGIQPWKNMLRRTRTMFERESEFIPQLYYEDAKLLARYERSTVSPPRFIDQLNYTGRKGATWHFCNQLEQNLTARNNAGEPKVTIIGHSMGAIVTCEMLQRFHRLPVDNVVLMAAACSINDFKNKIIPYLEEQNLRADFAMAAPNNPKFSAPVIKTQLYNLCLNDAAEHIEPNPGQLDLSQRGSLLTWIDTLYQTPESENDRTFGRWVNAVLATDDVPADVLGRITIKSFGLDRHRTEKIPIYTDAPGSTKLVDEPTKHGEFTRYQEGERKRKSNFRFWDPKYREIEEGEVKPGISSSGR